ncbi:hypothetical protein LO763_19600 [Glycomyces sp. A-F 0318]|uniref:hypothetical protein n=1 Tax=Glycomyces amatae TaxID=2881355 RepID=UPI001E31FEFF|nr:hypothetical protein [Glycomyces amatae]MCD0445817.1 hypothetical protein [Glycomyces amatae]
MATDDVLNGPNGDFATAVVYQARLALNNAAHGKPWHDMPDYAHAAVALALGDTDQMAAAGSTTLTSVMDIVSSHLAEPFRTMAEAEDFFFAVRARVDEETYAAFWDRLPQE